ncbi:TlyA family rRNA (cytidine-2'-O)-methyltransferase [Lactobacillus sp. S2-2]|uniref:TlyA family RNA methyltransferase n=1 Tax=Lactobacillus sp. S2-2 TaxID=2692917 RepID=UPI001F431614|nr:TlyA family RNA methyltransferase [Lactobacillus sp. S2-2]MCF6515106.1 TlyA family rRNA (cytidine-2'-O)-methyltransferase [Lactobacillus sp. S2-2]
MEKERLDVLLVNNGLFDTREQAKRAVMAGQILGDNEERLDKPGVKISKDTKLHFKGTKMPYVSRGGLKLERALKNFDISVKDLNVLDIGSSTGGFTDVMLQNGAKHSYALDVGTNQLVWKLRNDSRVTVMENTNFRYSKLSDFEIGQPEFASIDVSFISLSLILPPLKNIIKNQGSVVALIKPQFEAGKDKIGKHGIVNDRQVHYDVIDKVINFSLESGFSIENLDYSPIKGGYGNIEFLIHLKSSDEPNNNSKVTIENVLDKAYKSLNN